MYILFGSTFISVPGSNLKFILILLMFIIGVHLSGSVFPTVFISCGFCLIPNELSIACLSHESESSDENFIFRIVFSDLHIFSKMSFLFTIIACFIKCRTIFLFVASAKIVTRVNMILCFGGISFTTGKMSFVNFFFWGGVIFFRDVYCFLYSLFQNALFRSCV